MSDSKDQESVHAADKGKAAAAPPEATCAELKTAMVKCIADKGEENCKEATEAYKSCMKTLGFNV